MPHRYIPLMLIIFLLFQTPASQAQDSSIGGLVNTVNTTLASGKEVATYYYNSNKTKALAQHQQTKALLQRLPPNLAIKCAFSLQASFPPDKRIPAFIAEYSEIGFHKAILSKDYEAAAQLLGQTAAIYWTANDFNHAMQFFKEFGDFTDALISINPYDSTATINWQSLLTKDFLRRYIRFMYNTHSVRPQLCEQRGCVQWAWKMTEVIKSRLFRAQLLRSALARSGVLQARDARSLLEQIRDLKIKRNLARYTPEKAADVATYDRQLATLETAVIALLPEYKTLVTNIVTPQQISTRLAADETFLSFFYSDNFKSVYAWKIEHGYAEPIKLPIQTLPLYDKIIHVKALLSQDPSLNTITRALADLYEPLLANLQLQPKRRLIIAVDQNLSSLPFDLIPQPNGRLLMDDYEITYTPSATVFAWLRDQQERSSEYSERYALDYAGFSYLPQSAPTTIEQEVATAATKFSHAVSKPHVTEAELYKQGKAFSSARYVHLIAHNAIVPGHQGDFYLVLGAGDGEDGQLQSEEITERLQNHAALVVLSACETMPVGDEFKIGEFVALTITLHDDPEPLEVGSSCVCSYGESFSGLSGSFFAAGAHQLLLTQWQIPNTEATTALTNLFFEYLSHGKKPSDALKETKQHLRSTLSPMSWAGFILTSN